MGDQSRIEWTDATWNPVVGCSVVSPGCTNCYAMRTAARLDRMGAAKYAGLTREVNGNPVWTGTVRLDEKALAQPLRWRRPRRIFVNSMSDLFHEALPDAAIDRVFAVMALAPQHTFQVLTKRADRMRAYMGGPWTDQDGVAARIAAATWGLATRRQLPVPPTVVEVPVGPRLPNGQPEFGWLRFIKQWPLPNVWLGVSVEDQVRADDRIALLQATPATVRFLSAEPLLGPINLGFLRPAVAEDFPGIGVGPLVHALTERARAIDWVIVGGESGPGARPMHPNWVRALRGQCQAAGVPFFFKQWGEWFPGELEDDGAKLVASPDVEHNPSAVHWEFSFAAYQRLHCAGMLRIGKARAGRLLDGRTWDEMPA